MARADAHLEHVGPAAETVAERGLQVPHAAAREAEVAAELRPVEAHADPVREPAGADPEADVVRAHHLPGTRGDDHAAGARRAGRRRRAALGRGGEAQGEQREEQGSERAGAHADDATRARVAGEGTVHPDAQGAQVPSRRRPGSTGAAAGRD